MITDRSWIEIDLSNYEYNIREIKKHLAPQQKFMQIIKADAYGHGSYQIAMKAIEMGASLLGVANLDEALFIRYNKIMTPILILSPSLVSEIDDIISYDIIPTVNDLSFAQLLNQQAKTHQKRVKIHVNIDTGMNRSGVKANEALDFLAELISLDFIIIDGLFTHFAESEANPSFTTQQYKLFCKLLDEIKMKYSSLKPSYLHSDNSSAVINFNYKKMNLVRLGILTFGIYPHPSLKDKVKVKPVMKFKTRISQIKKARTGEFIGYNLTYQVKKDLLYAILPIGYADGYNYLLSNKGRVIVNSSLLPILGKVTMDMIIIDISQLEKPEIGDEVVLFGEENLRIEDITKLYQGSAYELATQTGKRAKRYYYSQGKIRATEPQLRRDFYSPDFSNNKLNNIIQRALKTRINSHEISHVLFSKIIANFIQEADNNISYRTNFEHHIEFLESQKHPDFYQVNTELSYYKTLTYADFLIACTTDSLTLDTYFRNPKVEYRWLLTDNIALNPESFIISEVSINKIIANITRKNLENVFEFHCTNDLYHNFIGKKCKFVIKTLTYYPKNSHQLSVFISEPTKEVKISFSYPVSIQNVETVTLFSGESKYPKICQSNNHIEVLSGKNTWILPNSGVIFTY